MFQGPSSTMAGEKESPLARSFINCSTCVFQPPHLNDQLIMHPLYVRSSRDCKHFFSLAGCCRGAHFYFNERPAAARRVLCSGVGIEISRSNYCGWNTRNASLSPRRGKGKIDSPASTLSGEKSFFSKLVRVVFFRANWETIALRRAPFLWSYLSGCFSQIFLMMAGLVVNAIPWKAEALLICIFQYWLIWILTSTHSLRKLSTRRQFTCCNQIFWYLFHISCAICYSKIQWFRLKIPCSVCITQRLAQKICVFANTWEILQSTTSGKSSCGFLYWAPSLGNIVGLTFILCHQFCVSIL